MSFSQTQTFHELEERWFARAPKTPRPSVRPAPAPAPPIGDPVADRWFK